MGHSWFEFNLGPRHLHQNRTIGEAGRGNIARSISPDIPRAKIPPIASVPESLTFWVIGLKVGYVENSRDF